MAASDNSVKILLIKANGKVFLVGGDLAEMQRAVDADDIQSLVKIAGVSKCYFFRDEEIT